MKERNRAYRRAQRTRLKQKRIRNHYWGIGFDSVSEWTLGQLGVAVNTPNPSRCYYMTNIRLFEGESVQERRSTHAMQYALRFL